VSEPPGRLFTPAFVALGLSELAYFTAAGMLIGATPFFVTGPLDGGKGSVGLAVGAFSVTALVLRPLSGRLSDRRGRKPLLVAGAALCAVVILGHLVVDELWMLVVLRLLLGATEAFFFVAGFAMLADLAPPGRTGEALSFNSLALYTGVALGPALGQALLDAWGFDWVWLGAAGLVALAAALGARIPETLERAVDDGAPPTPLFHPAALVPGFALLTGVAGMAGYFAFASLRAKDIGLDRWSLVLFVVGAVVVGCRIVFAKVPDRYAPRPLAAASLGVCCAGLTISALVGTASGLLVGAVVLAVGIAFLTPSVFTAIFAAVPPAERGAASGTASVFIDLGLGAGPMALGLVAAAGGTPAAFLAAAALSVAGAATIVLLPRRSPSLASN
jgi:MFS family permease